MISSILAVITSYSRWKIPSRKVRGVSSYGLGLLLQQPDLMILQTGAASGDLKEVGKKLGLFVTGLGLGPDSTISLEYMEVS